MAVKEKIGGKSGSGTTLVAHRGTNENIAKKLQQGYLPANYPNPNNAVTKALDHKRPSVWVSEKTKIYSIGYFLAWLENVERLQ